MEDRCLRCGSLKHTTEEHMRRMAEGRRKSPIWKEAHAKGNAKKRGKPLIFSDPEARAKKISKAQSTPEAKAWRSEIIKAAWQNRSDEQRKEIALKSSQKQKGKTFSYTHLKNLREANARPRTEEHKQHLSESLQGREVWNTGLTKATHPSLMSSSLKQKGRIPDYNKYRAIYDGPKGQIWMRSSWEVAYAEYLDRKNIDWLYEPKCFEIGAGDWVGESYIPDFLLKATDEFIEIKGRMSDDNECKLAKFKELYSDVKLSVLAYEELLAIGLIDKHRRLLDESGKVKKRKLSPEQEAERRRKLADSQIGRTKSPEHCAAIAQAHLGKKDSPETRAKKSAAHMSKLSPLQEKLLEVTKTVDIWATPLKTLAELIGISSATQVFGIRKALARRGLM